jgi:hypothetical protein
MQIRKLRQALGVFAIFGIVNITFGQENDEKKNELSIGSYIDTYFSVMDTESNPADFQPFSAVGPRDNSFGVNIAQVNVNYQNDRVRSEVIFHMGDIPSATWSNDFPALQTANVGIKLKEGLWLDAGFFGTHLGTESFLPKNNMLSSITVLTFNEPFYQSGAKLSWDASDSFYAELHVLNGYHSLVDNNDSKSVGILLSHSLSDNTSISYSNLYGNEADNGFTAQNRFYQNIYVNQNWNDKVYLTAGFDFGIQSNSDLNTADESASLYGGLFTLRYQFNPQWSVTGRGEMMKDENGFLTGVYTDVNGEIKGLEIIGLTLGSEFKPNDGAYLRAEMRYLETPSEMKLFYDGSLTNSRVEFMVTLGLEINKTFKF